MELEGMSTSVLLESYQKAQELELDDQFIFILKEALEHRLYTPVS